MLRELRFDGSDQAAATGKARQPLRDAHFRLAVQGGDAAIECCVQLHARQLDCIAWLRERNRNAEIPLVGLGMRRCRIPETRSEEHSSELQSLMRISYAVFCLN